MATFFHLLMNLAFPEKRKFNRGMLQHQPCSLLSTIQMNRMPPPPSVLMLASYGYIQGVIIEAQQMSHSLIRVSACRTSGISRWMRCSVRASRFWRVLTWTVVILAHCFCQHHGMLPHWLVYRSRQNHRGCHPIYSEVWRKRHRKRSRNGVS